MPQRWPRPFTSELKKRELLLVLVYLPVHLIILQLFYGTLVQNNTLTEPVADLLYYITGDIYMICAAFGFLRRDFDPLVDSPFHCIREIMQNYLGMMLCNFVIGMALLLVPASENPNNARVMEVMVQDIRIMKATIIYLAPIVEEMIFRAGIFGLVYRKNRKAAYIVSAVCFATYHVVPYAVLQPIYWLFMIEYIPVSILLARCYERTNSIWCSIFFHMMVNGISMSALSTIA